MIVLLELLSMTIKDQYTIVENPAVPYSAIRLSEASPWGGFIYSYGKVQMGKENPDGTCTVRFDYEVERPGPVTQDILNAPEFNKLLGDILIQLLEEGYGHTLSTNT
jgi:hypothetical protein